MEWISVEEKNPESVFHNVLITDGDVVSLGRYIADPFDYYGEDELEEIGEEWREPHWIFVLQDKEVCKLGPFRGNDECFGGIEEVSHWMNLPIPPKD